MIHVLHCRIVVTEHTAGVVCSKMIDGHLVPLLVSQLMWIFKFFFLPLRHFLSRKTR